MKDWNTLKKTERTESPSSVFRLRQNCTSTACRRTYIVCLHINKHVHKQMLLDATNTAVLAVGILNRRRKQNTIFEGKELENAVQNTNSYCQSQEVGIGLQQSLLYGER